MDVETIPPMKPVLVEHVSDDINVLQKDDVTKQKTVLTARAIEDVFKCAPIDRSNAADAKFFNAQNKVDLNLIIEACSRTLLADQYVNGPTIYVNNVKSTLDPINQHGNQWAVNNTPVAKVLHGFLYVYSVLDTGELTWHNYDHRISIDDQLDRSVDTRKISGKIRQVFVPNEFNDYLYMDGTKSDTYPKAHRSRYDLGVPWTRTGYPHYALTVGTVEEGKIYCTKSGDVYTPIAGLTVGQALPSNTYVFDSIVWEDWYMMSKTHNGPEYFTNIKVETTSAISNPLADAVYHIYNEVPSFTLPNANLDAYKVGQKIIVEVHPPITAAQSSCRVFYQDTLSRGESNVGAQQQILITPRVRRNNKDVYGRVTEDGLVTSVACFEIVEIKDGNNTYRTWELDGGVEETDFTSGLAQMLGEHTDRCSGDLVQYQRSSISNNTSITVAYPLTAAGFVVARFLKKDETETLVDNNWRAVVKIYHGNSDASFVKVTSSEYHGSPNSAYIYYRKENGISFTLAENNGHPTDDQWREEKEYYYIDLTHSTSVDVIQVIHGSGTTADGYLTLNDLQFGRMRGFSAYGNRGDVLSIEIITGSSKKISAFQGKVFPVVMFCPDPHDSYIHKASINPSAFTYNQLTQLFLDGTTVDDIRLANATELMEGLMNSPVSTRALIEAYTYLAQKLQSKGLLFGNCQMFNMTAAELNALVDGGFYFVKPKTLATTAGVFPPHMTMDGCNILVVSNKTAPGGLVHEEEGTVIAQDKAVQIAVIPGDPTDQTGDMFDICTRIGVKQANGTWVWSAWRSMHDWRNIDNMPEYFHARWDYFEDPNGMIDCADKWATKSGPTSGVGTAVYSITPTQIRALMDVVNIVDLDTLEEKTTGTQETTIEAADPFDFQYSTFTSRRGAGETSVRLDTALPMPVNYKVPNILVGVNELTVATVFGTKVSGNTYKYLVDINLPKAVAVSSLSDTEKHRRRKIRFMFIGKITGMDWNEVAIQVHYNGSESSSAEVVAYNSSKYKYRRVWGADFATGKSIIDLEFEQVDLPNGERIWSPIEIG